MGTKTSRDRAQTEANITALEQAMANSDKIVRFADGTYVEYSSFEQVAQRLAFFQNQLAEQDGRPRHSAYRLRLNRGI